MRSLVALHGGTVSAHSDGVGRGSAFTVRFPLALRPADDLAPSMIVDEDRPSQAVRPHRIRLIAVTGYGQERDRRRSADAGFEAHLVKPVDLAQLRTLIEEGEAARDAEPSHPDASDLDSASLS